MITVGQKIKVPDGTIVVHRLYDNGHVGVTYGLQHFVLPHQFLEQMVKVEQACEWLYEFILCTDEPGHETYLKIESFVKENQ